ncbi:MAG: hypothetical protein PHS37_05040, partial [Candidatus Omnitrophica bacterium]|nr:hypothetical protein [Candidatus Omnitrophota bacterium]
SSDLFPGSPLSEHVKKMGWLMRGPSGGQADWTLFEQNFSVIDTPFLRHEEVMSLRERIIKEFYLNPSKILSTVAKIRSPREIAFFINFARSYFSSWVRQHV